MSQEFIQIGIDLGTTNSEVAVFTNGKVEIVKNIYQDSFTPSVFGVDKIGNKIVGKKAYENLFLKATADEVSNNKTEVKRLMGTADKVEFPRINKSFNAEEISAEILKSLKEDIYRKYPEFNTSSVVITVPAYFSIIQSEATMRAGNLAGFEHVVLLQEPIAAALSYGFSVSGNQNWLVYDLGGGTFDVAIISSRDGSLTVLETGGDNFLGGKNIDWAIVEKIIVPAINEKYQLKNFNRSNPKFQYIFTRLKYLAEQVKKYLSQAELALIEVSLELENHQTIELDIELTRSSFEEIIQPLIKKTIDISKETIKKSGISFSAINKVVLVGGPTQIPYVRNTIERELNIKVDTTVDCLTAVATGACLYGLSKRIPKNQDVKDKKNNSSVFIDLHYSSLTSETDEPIAGFIDDRNSDSYTLQIQSENGLYTSDKISLKKGKFMESITVEPNKTNLFWLYLFDEDGNPISVEPDSFAITHGLSEITGAPISHSIGVSLLKNSEGEGEFDVYFEKGSNLPLKKTKKYRTALKLSRGKDADLLILVLEGESSNPENNIYICNLGINGKELPHDLPAGTDIDVTILVNESRELFVNYYIPSLDKRGNSRVTQMDENLDVKKLSGYLEKEKEKYNKIMDLCTDEEKKNIENMIATVESSVSNAEIDKDDKKQADKEIKEIRDKVEKLSENKKFAKLKSDFKNFIMFVPKIIEDSPGSSDKAQGIELFEQLEIEGEKSIETDNEVLLARTNEQLIELAVKFYYLNPLSWLDQFERHESGKFAYTNTEAAQYFIEKGKKAVQNQDNEAVKEIVIELQNLMVDENERSISAMISGLTR